MLLAMKDYAIAQQKLEKNSKKFMLPMEKRPTDFIFKSVGRFLIRWATSEWSYRRNFIARRPSFAFAQKYRLANGKHKRPMEPPAPVDRGHSNLSHSVRPVGHY